MKYGSIPRTAKPSPIYSTRPCTEAPSGNHEQAAQAYLLCFPISLLAVPPSYSSNTTTFPPMAHLPIKSSSSPASGLDKRQNSLLEWDSSCVDREDSDVLASYIHRRRKFTCIWSSITLLLSAGSGIGSGLVSKSLDVGLGIGTAVLTVLAVVQSIVALSHAMSKRKDESHKTSCSNSKC
jgi:hypothetical protein